MTQRMTGGAGAARPLGWREPATERDLTELRVPARGRYDEAARRERLEWLRARTGAGLEPLDEMRLVPERLTANVENAIGAVEVPVGIAGPLRFHGEAARGLVYAPLATTEGALVASASRGASAITSAGGVTTRVLRQRMTRAPAFELATAREAFRVAEWIAEQLPALRERVGHVSRHADLRSVEPVLVGRAVHVLFAYETGDAAGQNMTTAATWHVCQWVLDQLPGLGVQLERFLIEANLSSDKKVNVSALLGERAGRGYAVTAECVLDEGSLRRWLKTTPEELLRAHALMRDGAAQARMVGHNINVANTVAAIFTATGQDIACVHESSLGELTLARVPEGVQARLSLPGLVVGTVGGGTHLPAQRALLELLGCVGEGTGRRLAEIVGGFCLALDLSTMAAVATGEFASAHERLGRNRPVEPLSDRELDAAFFERGLRRQRGDAVRVQRVEDLDAEEGASILGDLTARRFGKRTGVLHRRLHHDAGSTDVVVKVKPLDAEVQLMLQGLATSCGRRVGEAFARVRSLTGFAGCHLRELAVYEQTDPRFVRHVPAVYDIVRDPARESFAVVLERLSAGSGIRLLDSADDPSGWRGEDVDAALAGIGAVHAIWMGREDALLREPWIGLPPTAARMAAMRPLWDALAEHAADEFPRLMPERELRRQQSLIAAAPAWWARIETLPRTLVHNDFNPRNIALRTASDGGAPVLCAFDWELATLHLPQHDAAELLAFVLASDVERREVLHHVEAHRRAVAAAGAAVPDARAWREGFALAARDLLVNRFALYLMGHAFRHYGFLERSLATLRHLIDLELEKG